MIIKVLIPVILILLILVFIMSIGIFFSKKKRFPDGSISKNPELKKMGLKCAKHDELAAYGVSSCCGGRFERELNKEKAKEKSEDCDLKE